MKLLSYLIIATCIICSCSSEEEPVLLTIGEMVDVLQDLHVARARVDTDNAFAKNKNAEREILYASVLSHSNIDREQFAYSYDYYMDHPVELDTIYARVIRELNVAMRNAEDDETDEQKLAPEKSPAFSTPASNSQ